MVEARWVLFKTVAGKAKGQLKQAKNRTEKKQSVESWWPMVDEIPPWAVMVALWRWAEQFPANTANHRQPRFKFDTWRDSITALSELCVYGFGPVMRWGDMNTFQSQTSIPYI